MWYLWNELRIYLGEFQVKTFGKVLLTGALALGGLTAMNIDTPKAHADGASEFCRYICGPSETVNGVTVQVHSTQVTFGNSVIARITNDRAEEIHYNVSLERNMAIDGENLKPTSVGKINGSQLEAMMKLQLSQDMAMIFMRMEHIVIKSK